MQSLDELNAHFGIAGALEFFAGHGGLTCARITTAACSAEVYLHGAHLTAWQPAGHEPVLFLSERSAFAEDKAIRGGVPVIFPWFGARTARAQSPRTDGPSHGFARTSLWKLAFAAVVGEDLHLTLTLGPNEASRALGYDDFQLACLMVLGRSAKLRLLVANESSKPLHFEEAFHSYFNVGDARRVEIGGLGLTEYLDKTDNFFRKLQSQDWLTLTQETDRPYLNTSAAVRLEDPVLRRRITVGKMHSRTTVVWNPWTELTAKLADMEPDGWQRMTCIETANVAENAVVLAPSDVHIMEARFFVQGYTDEPPDSGVGIAAPSRAPRAGRSDV